LQTFAAEERSLHGAAASHTATESSSTEFSFGGRATIERASGEFVAWCGASGSIYRRGTCRSNRGGRDDGQFVSKLFAGKHESS
jgi:hypothetical protein